MNVVSLILGRSNTVVALLLIGLSLPLLRGAVRPNATYGFRFPKAFESDAAWFAINRYGAQRLILWSIPLLLLGIATFFLPRGLSLPAIIAIANAPLIVIIPILETRKRAKQVRSES